MFKQLLVPLDGTPEAAAAVPPALALARATGAAIRLLRVIPQGATAQSARPDLDRLASELAGAGAAADVRVREGAPADEILAETVERRVDLIVMATHGRGGLRRAILGSVATDVLGRSTVPTLLVRPGGRRLTHLRTLLVPLDGTPGAALALAAALDLAQRAGARIELLRVQPPSSSLAYLGDPTIGTIPRYHVDPAWDEEARLAAQGYVERMAQRLGHAGVVVEGRAIVGEVAETIEATAAELDADLIVMSTHALTGPARAVLGSVADAVVRGADRPVLLVRRMAPFEDAARPDDRESQTVPQAR